MNTSLWQKLQSTSQMAFVLAGLVWAQQVGAACGQGLYPDDLDPVNCPFFHVCRCYYDPNGTYTEPNCQANPNLAVGEDPHIGVRPVNYTPAFWNGKTWMLSSGDGCACDGQHEDALLCTLGTSTTTMQSATQINLAPKTQCSDYMSTIAKLQAELAAIVAIPPAAYTQPTITGNAPFVQISQNQINPSSPPDTPPHPAPSYCGSGSTAQKVRQAPFMGHANGMYRIKAMSARSLASQMPAGSRVPLQCTVTLTNLAPVTQYVLASSHFTVRSAGTALASLVPPPPKDCDDYANALGTNFRQLMNQIQSSKSSIATISRASTASSEASIYTLTPASSATNNWFTVPANTTVTITLTNQHFPIAADPAWLERTVDETCGGQIYVCANQQQAKTYKKPVLMTGAGNIQYTQDDFWTEDFLDDANGMRILTKPLVVNNGQAF